MSDGLLNGVVIDLSSHASSYAVILNGQLLPIRFKQWVEAADHYDDLKLRTGEADGKLDRRAGRPTKGAVARGLERQPDS